MILGTQSELLIKSLHLLMRSPFMIDAQMRIQSRSSRIVVPPSPAVMQENLPLLKREDRGEMVEKLQGFLNLAGADPKLPGTRYFGEMTWRAVMLFQTREQVTPIDGIVGPKTWAALERVLGVRIKGPSDKPSSTATSGSRNYHLYGQAQKEWAKDTMGANGGTLQAYGCTVTSIAMALRTAGVTVNTEDCTPKNLNQYLKDNGGYTADSRLNWTVVANLSGVTFGKREKKGKVGVLTETEIATLLDDEDNMVLLNVKAGGHWVLVESKAAEADGEFICCDPGSGSGVRKRYNVSNCTGYAYYVL